MESRDRDRLEQWLDGALRQREIAEPRPGLEGRILARIALESQRHRTPKSWAWVFATAAVTALLAVFGAGVWHDSEKAPPLEVPAASRNSAPARGAHSSAPVSLSAVVRNQSERKHPHAVVATMAPKPDHFPSPRPLSEQELALENYAERFPAEAALIAQDQQKFDQEIAKAQEEAENTSSPNP